MGTLQAKRDLNPRYQVVTDPDRYWYGVFKAHWQNCTLCPLHQHRNHVVHFRGLIPSRICFIGEAPGASEDELGRPFVGKAGRLFDELIEQAGLEDGDFCVFNTVGCYPFSPEKNTFRAPTRTEVKTCSPRLQELVQHAQPKLLALLGSIAVQSVPVIPEACQLIHLAHPSFIERRGRKPTDIKRFVLTLQQAISKLQ